MSKRFGAFAGEAGVKDTDRVKAKAKQEARDSAAQKFFHILRKNQRRSAIQIASLLRDPKVTATVRGMLTVKVKATCRCSFPNMAKSFPADSLKALRSK